MRTMSNNSDILLTVAIPTYNRPQTLERILLQLSQEKNQSFYTLIADDYDSPSQTHEVVNAYQNNNPRLIYHKNPHNLGFSPNVLQIYELAQTRYIWYLCDDETLIPGCIDTILTTIRNHQPRVAYFGFTQIDPYGREIVTQSSSELVLDKLDTFTDHLALLRGNLLSVVVFEKTSLSLTPIKVTNYKDNVFIQLTMALYLLSDKFKLCVIPTPVVHRNVGYKYGDFYKFNFVDALKAVYAIDHKFNRQQFRLFAVRNLTTNFLLYLSQKLGLYRFSFNPTKQTIRHIFRYYGYYSFFVFAIPVVGFFVPTFLLKIVYFMKLYTIHGYERARVIYRQNIDRAYRDGRDTGYTSYR